MMHSRTGHLSSVTNSEANSWMSVDLGAGRALCPSHYCLRHDNYSGYTLRHWTLEGSADDGGRPSVSGGDRARAERTFVGDGNRVGGGTVEGAYRGIVDFAGGPLKDLSADAPVTSAFLP